MHPSQGMRTAQMPISYPYSNSMSMSPQYSYVSSPIANFRTLPLSPSLSPTTLSNMQQISQVPTTAQLCASSPSLTQVFVSVRGLPSTATKADLVGLFEPFGPLTHISLSGTQALIGTTAEALNTMMCYFVNSPLRIHNKFVTLHLIKQMSPTTSFSVPSSPASFRRGLSPQISPRQFQTPQQGNGSMSVPFASIQSPSSLPPTNVPSQLSPSMSSLNSTILSNGQSFTPVPSFMPMNSMNVYDPNLNLNSSSFNHQLNPNIGNTNNTLNSQAVNYSSGFTYPTTSVVLVSNLPTTSAISDSSDLRHEEITISDRAEQTSCLFNCDDLFTLFGIYGDVLRVKILFHHPSSALIQLASPLHAEMCIQYLNHIVLYGRQLSVTPSKYSEVEVPKSEENIGRSAFDHSPLTKEYLRSPAHRFRNVKNTNTNTYLRNLHPLSTVLHVSSIASTVTEVDLKEMFSVDIDPEDVCVQFIEHSQAPSSGSPYSENNTNSPIPTRKPRSSSISSTAPTDLNCENDSQTNISSPALSSSSQADSPTSMGSLSSLSHPPPSPHSLAHMTGNTSLVPQKQAFIRLPSLQAAVLALIRNHNKLVEGRYMRVSFARKEPSAITNTPERVRRASLPGNPYNLSSSQNQSHKPNKPNVGSWTSSVRSSSGSSSVTSSPSMSGRSNINSGTPTKERSSTPTFSRLRPFVKADPPESYDTKTRQHPDLTNNKDNITMDNLKQNFEKSMSFHKEISDSSTIPRNSKVMDMLTTLNNGSSVEDSEIRLDQRKEPEPKEENSKVSEATKEMIIQENELAPSNDKNGEGNSKVAAL